MNKNEHVKNSVVRYRRRHLCKKTLKRFRNGQFSVEAEVWLREWMLRVEDGVLAWKIALHFHWCQSTWVVLEEPECTVKRADDIDRPTHISYYSSSFAFFDRLT